MTHPGVAGARVIERQCVACRRLAPRHELIRLVRLPSGEVALDNRYKLHGRGAYVCRNRACTQAAGRKGGLARALKSRVPDDLMQSIIALGQEMS